MQCRRPSNEIRVGHDFHQRRSIVRKGFGEGVVELAGRLDAEAAGTTEVGVFGEAGVRQGGLQGLIFLNRYNLYIVEIL